MISCDVIIVGGGPAGSSCAWKLARRGIECIILDKHVFPRTKLCAGWITPQVVRSLEMDLARYPHSLIPLGNFHFHIYGRKFKFTTPQYLIRRYEFDDWLMKRSGVPVYNHDVCEITRDGEHYVVDDIYRCRYLVGAGGTYCPVYRTFFKEVSSRVKESLVTTMEEEFAYDHGDRNCHLWFFENKLPGYSWYVPKGKGHVNIGIGGKTSKLKRRGDTIKDHWDLFVNKLRECSMVDDRSFNPKGYHYYQTIDCLSK